MNGDARLPAEAFEFCGRTVGGIYTCLTILGHGGFGVVYRGVDADGKTYALKCVLKGTPDSAPRRAFSREWSMNKRLGQHAGVVRCHAAIQHGRYMFLVFDFCPGGDLFDHVTERGTYFRNDALIKTAFLSLLDATKHLHDRSIFHHDIKLENVLSSKDGSQLYLADFGLSTMHEKSNTTGVGSRDYQPPEALREQLDFDHFSVRQVDIWGLGMVLINMITSRNPWGESTTEDPAYQAFLSNPAGYLYQTMPLSTTACRLFARVFDWNPFGRPSLEEFRIAVLEMETFFMTDAELAVAPPIVRSAMCEYGGAGEDQRLPPAPAPVSDEDDSSVTADFLEDSVYMMPEAAGADVDVTPRPAAGRHSFNARTASSSVGPATPESRPVRDVDIAGLTMSLSSLAMTSLARPVNPISAGLGEPVMKHYEPTRKSVMRNAMRQMGLI